MQGRLATVVEAMHGMLKEYWLVSNRSWVRTRGLPTLTFAYLTLVKPCHP